MTLRDRLRPWHGLMALTFVLGVGFSLARRGTPGSVGVPDALTAVLLGLFAVVILQFTVGNVWGYAVEYANAGGSWTDAPFLAPFVVGLVVTVTVVVVNPGLTSASVLAAALWSGFWGFVVTAAVVAVVVRFVSGYAVGRS